MTSSPILRSVALQKSLALAPARAPSTAAGTSFASTLVQAQSKTPSSVSRINPRSVSGAASTNATLAAGGAVPFKSEITAAATKYGVDPALMAGLVKAESGFNPKAQSKVGAKGLTQLMDATARGLGVTDAFDPGQSLDAGAKFLGGLLKQFHGNESLALAAYNAGPGAVQKYGGIPPYEETQRYVPKVLGFATQFRRIWADSTGS
jgi:soluble lytic murein transglycosylase-like protein